MRFAVVLIAGFTLIAGSSVAAGPGVLEISSAEPVAIDGRVAVEMGGASVEIVSWRESEDLVLRGATGIVSIWSWRAFVADGPITIVQSLEPASRATASLDNATLLVRYAGERAKIIGLGEPGEGAVSIAGQVTQAGVPHRLPAQGGSRALPVETPRSPGGPPWLEAEWPAGSWYVGNFADRGLPLGVPSPDGPSLSLRGGVRVEVIGGNASFVDADGRSHSVRLGNWSAATGFVEEWSLLHFEGSVDSASLPASEEWGVGGAEAVWEFDGRLAWSAADGTWSTEGEHHVFRDADVAGFGRVLVRLGRGLVVIEDVLPVDYTVDGEWRELQIGGAHVERAVTAPLPAVGHVALAALLLAFLFEGPRSVFWKVVLSSYTRIGASDALANAQRRRIHEIVNSQPGIHLRALARDTGLSWSTIRFHLRVLRETGYVRVARERRYLLLFPSAASGGAGAPPIPHPIARGLFQRLPCDGSPMAFADARRELGVSRQRLTYHLRGLEARGLVNVRLIPGEGLTVARSAGSNAAAPEGRDETFR